MENEELSLKDMLIKSCSELTEKYEDLRKCIVDSDFRQKNLGVALFFRKGMVGWFTTLQQNIQDDNTTKINDIKTDVTLPTDLRGNIADILTNMLLSERIKGGCHEVL